VSAAASWVAIPAVAVLFGVPHRDGLKHLRRVAGVQRLPQSFHAGAAGLPEALLVIGGGSGQSLSQGSADREVQVLEIVHRRCRRSGSRGICSTWLVWPAASRSPIRIRSSL